MSTNAGAVSYWQGGALQPVRTDDESVRPSDQNDVQLLAADSWLVSQGTALALELHRERFLGAVAHQSAGAELVAEEFWEAAIAAIAQDSDQFPRMELLQTGSQLHLSYRQRAAPPLTRSLTVETLQGTDPRTEPTIKGPDIAALNRARAVSKQRGVDETVIVSPEGHVVDGATTAIAWWHGDALCTPSPELARVDSITAKSLLTLAAALGIDVLYDSVTPEQLESKEVWALNALHGIRIVTNWAGGPKLAAEPGRLQLWQSRLHRLRKPVK